MKSNYNIEIVLNSGATINGNHKTITVDEEGCVFIKTGTSDKAVWVIHSQDIESYRFRYVNSV